MSLALSITAMASILLALLTLRCELDGMAMLILHWPALTTMHGPAYGLNTASPIGRGTDALPMTLVFNVTLVKLRGQLRGQLRLEALELHCGAKRATAE